MKPLLVLLALVACGMLTACAAQRPPSTPPTLPPSECLTACPALPRPPAAPASEQAVEVWVLELIGSARECRRMHEACRLSR